MLWQVHNRNDEYIGYKVAYSIKNIKLLLYIEFNSVFFFISSIELRSCLCVLNDHFSIKSIENTNDMLLFSIASAIKECKMAFFSKLRRLLNYPLSAHDLISGDKLKLNDKKMFSEYSSPKKNLEWNSLNEFLLVYEKNTIWFRFCHVHQLAIFISQIRF